MFSFLQDVYDNFLYNYSPLLKRITPKAIYQKLTRGFTDNDLYNLDKNIAKIIHKRIKAYAEINCNDEYYCSMPSDYKHLTLWKRDLNKMIFAFEKLADTSQNWLDADKYYNKIKNSNDPANSTTWVKIVETRREYVKSILHLFAENFGQLWI